MADAKPMTMEAAQRRSQAADLRAEAARGELRLLSLEEERKALEARIPEARAQADELEKQAGP